MKPFNQWYIQEVEESFHIQRIYDNHPVLNAWLNDAQQLLDDVDETDKIYIQRLQNELRKNIDYWQEEELKFHFIGPLVNLVGFNREIYSTFLDRKLSATINDMELSGKTDFMVAKGKQIPKQPFFFSYMNTKKKKAAAMIH